MKRRRHDVILWFYYPLLVATILICALALVSCTKVVEKRVEVPVQVTRVVERPVLPPASLLTSIPAPEHIWLSPLEPEVSSCVAPEGEDALLRFLSQHLIRQQGLRNWVREVQP